MGYRDGRGSPPRGRGKVPETYRYVAGYGITPAWAGKSREQLQICEKQEDHPRVGGEKFLPECQSALFQGSPPRGRGKAILAECWHGFIGITPAWAGKSGSRKPKKIVEKDHPRVGGEKGWYVPYHSDRGGSPPRGRGKATFWGKVRGKVRITPAWAGKSLCSICSSGRLWGSPPRGRGKVSSTMQTDFTTGITPAWAGKSNTTECFNISTRDHPRVGGEKRLMVLVLRAVTGSPPRGRGKD